MPLAFFPAVRAERSHQRLRAASTGVQKDCQSRFSAYSPPVLARLHEIFQPLLLLLAGPRKRSCDGKTSSSKLKSLKQEAWEHFLVFGQRHFDDIVREFVDYDHDCRPHQGIGNALLTRSRAEPDRAEPDVPPLISPRSNASNVSMACSPTLAMATTNGGNLAPLESSSNTGFRNFESS